MESRIHPLMDKLEERHAQHASIASDLVHHFLMPEVQRQQELRTGAFEAQKFANAARRAINATVDAVEQAMADE